MVGALDDVDRVDLHVAEVLDGGAHRRRSGAERRFGVEVLGGEPEASGGGQVERARGGHGAFWPGSAGARK